MRAALAPFAAAILAGPAWSDDAERRTQIDGSADALFVLSPGRDDAGGFEAQTFVYEIGLSGEVTTVLDNGAEIGVRATARVQRDHPARAGFSGNLSADPAALGLLLPRGAFSGLSAAGPLEDTGARGAVEAAYIYIDGGYGEALAGRDLGVAARFFEGPRDVFTHARAVNPLLDPGGVNIVRTQHDITGPSAKVSYATPRILGVRAGLSFTPLAEAPGLDRDADRSGPGVEPLQIRNTVEVALGFSRRLRGPGVRLRWSGAYSRADVRTEPPVAPRPDLSTFSTGAEAEWRNLSLGASFLTSNNSGGRYTAWSAGARVEALGLEWAASYGRADDDLVGATGESWSLGVRKQFLEQISVAVGVQESVLEPTESSTVSTLGPVIEISLGL